MTVFAPTDAAFDALPAGALAALLADNDALTDALLYHVAAGTYMSGDLSDGQMITMLQGQDVTVSISGSVMINNAVVTTADVVASNGVVHVIDAVLLPPAIVTMTIADIVNASPEHTTLAAALNLSGFGWSFKC
ncbi:MAG: fasciclin domain-containing protein [Flavobacteriales bacterium]